MKRTCIPKQTLPALPCHVDNPDVWLAETPADLECAKTFCASCPIRCQCLTAAAGVDRTLGCVVR